MNEPIQRLPIILPFTTCIAFVWGNFVKKSFPSVNKSEDRIGVMEAILEGLVINQTDDESLGFADVDLSLDATVFDEQFEKRVRKPIEKIRPKIRFLEEAGVIDVVGPNTFRFSATVAQAMVAHSVWSIAHMKGETSDAFVPPTPVKNS